jgi:hypothetical protein
MPLTAAVGGTRNIFDLVSTGLGGNTELGENGLDADRRTSTNTFSDLHPAPQQQRQVQRHLRPRGQSQTLTIRPLSVQNYTTPTTATVSIQHWIIVVSLSVVHWALTRSISTSQWKDQWPGRYSYIQRRYVGSSTATVSVAGTYLLDH